MLTRRRMLALAAGTITPAVALLAPGGAFVAPGGAFVVPGGAFLAPGGALAAPAVATAATAASPPLRLGLLQFGSGAWEIAAMEALGLVAAGGITLATTRLASNDAGRIAFQAGAVDAMLGDLLWAARVKAEGRDVRYLPFSSAEGAVMVPEGSPVRSIADLAGRRLGVAGGALDKSWLLLKAHARASGLDLEAAAQPVFAAPPLLAAELEQGRLDAALLYWTFCARLEPKGFRRLMGVADLVRGLGIAPEPTLVGYIFDGGFVRANPDVVARFVAASHATKALMAAPDPDLADPAWAAARPQMQATDEATFAALKRGFIAGVPRLSIAAERASAAALYEVLARLGGAQLVGPAPRLPEGLYLDPDLIAR